MNIEIKEIRGPSESQTIDASNLGLVGKLFTVRLQRAEYLLSAATSNAWSRYALRAGSVGVLSIIASEPGISQIQIAKRTTIDKSAITAIVNQFEQLGWAERRPSTEDRRRHALFVTAEGNVRLREFVDRIEAIEAKMLADVPLQTLAKLCELLDEVHASCLSAIQS